MSDRGYFAVVLLVLAVIGFVIYVNMVFERKNTSCSDKGGVLVKALSGYVCVKKEAVL